MKTVVVTGSGGLIGAQSVRHFARSYERVIGIDNDMRAYFFGDDASTKWAVKELSNDFANYEHHEVDIRDRSAVDRLFGDWSTDVELIIHTAAQPSHDWAAKEPFTDFDVNAGGTLNLLEATRRNCPAATFILTSTNKVYGDTPNRLPLIETERRWELHPSHEWAATGIPESMSIDGSTHSLFGASKVAADILTQEYGRYFGLRTGVFRGGCLTGPGHSGAQLHGFLAYLMKCTVAGDPYTVFGYEGKQVRDNIHASDLVNAFDAFHRAPRPGEAYNIGGGLSSNCSMLEAIELCEEISGHQLRHSYEPTHRTGDHIWWVSDLRKFRSHFPEWNVTYDVRAILQDIHDHGVDRWTTNQ
jgi:CDP-paratose 2-epimerase